MNDPLPAKNLQQSPFEELPCSTSPVSFVPLVPVPFVAPPLPYLRVSPKSFVYRPLVHSSISYPVPDNQWHLSIGKVKEEQRQIGIGLWMILGHLLGSRRYPVKQNGSCLCVENRDKAKKDTQRRGEITLEKHT